VDGAVARLSGVTHRYGHVAALDDVTVDLPAGAAVGIIGPDGVGKSTLLALIAGVRKLQSGSVTVLDGDVAKAAHRRAISPRIAYMPQGLGRNLYPTLSVVENIDFFARLYGQAASERARRIEDLLVATGLDPFPDRPAGQLSGGMKQKLALCCSLIHDPDLLILDEPTTGIDPLSRRQFWQLIDRIRSRRPGLSLLTATAYMEEAAGFDHLVAMHAGKILATGTPADVVRRSGASTLEEAFIALLPEGSRRRHRAVVIPPRRSDGPTAAIEVEHLTARFGTFTAVDDVTLRVERGEIFGFLGSNGCGKTTTMKMLTGLLAPSGGTARIFGHAIDPRDLETRKRVGYMSQSFSLYSELTVRQNLDLHGHLFGLPAERIAARVDELLDRFELAGVADTRPDALPLGVRQRLQLAVAMVHRPEMLILDEPTSGVDPIARDGFWEQLVQLSRDDGVTIFLSTHFVNEAARCDRVSLMHAGRVLAIGTPAELAERRGAATLEDAFIGYLGDAAGSPAIPTSDGAALTGGDAGNTKAAVTPMAGGLDPGRIWAFSRREALELVRDPIRIAFALFAPLILAVAMAYGISFDIESVPYAVLDGDRSRESRALLENFSSSRYFDERPAAASAEELEQRLVSGELRLGLIVPPDYGRDLVRGEQPEVGVLLDGANTFRAETARGYVQGVLAAYVGELVRRAPGATAALVEPVTISPRFRYNQAFLSLYAISPGVMMMILIMFSAMLTALGIVREKELGSITNLYAAPASKLEFLIGKQLPYVVVALVSFGLLALLIVAGFGVPLTGSFTALALGALVYAFAATAFGLVVSSFVRSQIAAIFASAIVVSIPTINFSGMMYPVSTLEGGARVIGELFPALYFQRISAGVFNKGLGLADLYVNHLALAGFAIAFLVIAQALLGKQEP
jgi:ribosome-dependent ATPase